VSNGPPPSPLRGRRGTHCPQSRLKLRPVLVLQAGDRHDGRPLQSELVVHSAVATVVRWFRTGHSLRDGLPPLRVPVATPEPFDGLFVRPIPSGTDPPHWLTVATPVGPPPTAFARTTRNHGWHGVTRLALGLLRPHRLFDHVAATHALAASPPCVAGQGSATFPAGAGDICLAGR
jgi:hypothetical protein